MPPIIKKEHVALATSEQAPRRRRGHAKVASLLRVAGEVRAIEVTCSCGEKLVVELDYEQGSASELAATNPGEMPNPDPSVLTAAPAESGPPEELPS